MTPQEIEAAKAAFLAKGGAVTTAPEGVAYGVSAAADAAKRDELREARRFELIERQSETHIQRVREERGYYGR